MLPFPIMNTYGNIAPQDEYKRLQDEIQADSTARSVLFNQSYSTISSGPACSRVYFQAVSTYAGTMWGTSYNNKFTYDSTFCRVVQHAFPTQQLYTEFLASTRICVLVRSAIVSGTGYISLNRNGYNSTTYSTFNGTTLTQFIYYDESTSRVMQYNPSIASTPTRYYTN